MRSLTGQDIQTLDSACDQKPRGKATIIPGAERHGWKHAGYNFALAAWRSQSGIFDLQLTDIESLSRALRRTWPLSPKPEQHHE